MIRDSATFEEMRRTVAKFVDRELVPRESEMADTGVVPESVLREMRELGLFGFAIPEQYGGLGLTMEEEVEFAFELGRASPAFRSAIGTNNGIGSQGLILAGTEAQRSRYLPRLANGDLVASFALTEPDAGSDAADLRTYAEKTEGGWRLTGTKRFITNAPKAGLLTVFARTGPKNDGPRGISAFLVEMPREGVSLGAPYRTMGQRGASVCDVILDGALVPDEALLGGAVGVGFSTAMRVLDRGRLHIAAVCVGAARRLLSEMAAYASQRKQFGRTIGEFQLVQAMLADSRVELLAARAMVRETAKARDQEIDVSIDASCCKLFASEMVGRVADRAVQTFGGSGYIDGNVAERFYRDVRLFRLYEGTSQIQQLIVARGVLKEFSGG
jgi:acyl-CoA dehydrogenase